MEFAAPLYGWLAVPVLLTLLLVRRGERKRAEALRRFAEPRLRQRLLGPEGRVGQLRRRYLPILIMLLLVAALMRPQWGVIEEERSTSGIDVLFAIDLSRSMLADDLAPSRLAVARQAVARVLAAMPEDRVGLIGFAGSAFLLCPLTSDRAMPTRILAELTTDTLPKGGSSVAAALREAARAFRGAARGGRLLVLLSDGEDHGGEIGQALADLGKEGVAVLAAAVGTPEGGLMPLPDGNFVKDRRGRVVKSRALPETLRLLDPAATTLSADGANLGARIADARKGLSATARKGQKRRLAERFQIPLGAALLLWGLGVACSGRSFGP